MKAKHDDTPSRLEGDCAMSPPQEALAPTQVPAGPGRERPGDIRRLVEFLELILDNVYSGIIVCDRNSRIIYMNQVYAELLGTDRHRAVGRPIEEYFPNSQLPRVMATGQAELGQRCGLRTEAPLLVNRIPLRRDGQTIGVILQTIFRDYQAFTDLLARLNLLEREVKYYKENLGSVLSARYTFDSILGQSQAMEEVKRVSRKYARTEAPVLILGATGTGKELFAHAVHTFSPRSSGPFVCVNCAAIPRELLESELFGYESGAFTGASKKGKPGQIELAHQGTLYLDEIGDLPLNAQAKLLRVLESKTLDRLGGVKSILVDFRLVASTNQDLSEMIGRGEFREDLFYRLNTLTVTIPPLAQRPEDISLLVRSFLKALGKAEVKVSRAALETLQAYPWPGNVRELKNLVERAVSLAEGEVIDLEHLPQKVFGLAGPAGPVSGSPDSLLTSELARYEKGLLERTLRLTGRNMSRAAKILGISRSTLYEKCGRHDLI